MGKQKKKTAPQKQRTEKRDGPVLSVGIIFKNEIRCLERCLRSFDTLRQEIPMEIVMADTGSTDGSREVAARYADVLFDFPWINDFAAARNAVMDRCSGAWYLTVDSDEWLDDDHTELLKLLRGPHYWESIQFCSVVVRNYTRRDLKDDYSDFNAIRMALMSTGQRYSGAIHEAFSCSIYECMAMQNTVLHHDGYVMLNEKGEQGKAKRERNRNLLLRRLEENPNDLKVILQCMDNSVGEEQRDFVLRGIQAVRDREEEWEKIGPAIYRNAVSWALAESWPEAAEWCAEAHRLFPKALLVRVDIGASMLIDCSQRKDYAGAIPYGEEYLEGLADFRQGNRFSTDVMIEAIHYASSLRERQGRILLARAYCETGRLDEAAETLAPAAVEELNIAFLGDCFSVVADLFSKGCGKAEELLASLWAAESAKDAEDGRNVLNAAGMSLFSKQRREKEDEEGWRHGYELFLPLRDKWELGLAAAVMECRDPEALTEMLASVKEWKFFPIPALVHALNCGARFSVPEITAEEMVSLAGGLAAEDALSMESCLAPAPSDGLRELGWRRARLYAAMALFDGTDEDGKAHGQELARAYAETERDFLSAVFSQTVLAEENLFLLSPACRFGWYCACAFQRLDAGDPAGYVRFLREGLKCQPGMKKIVEFLAEQLSRQDAVSQQASVEMMALAARVKAVLAQFDPDDPAVLQLKQSPMYQKVAYLIEEGGD